MWKLNKPCINTTTKDIDELISHCRVLNQTDKLPLETLYKTYDRQNGNVTIKQHDTIVQSKANAIYRQYDKTDRGKELNYIRAELNSGIDLCPHCSISEVSNLDHFMPRSKYEALSVCRLNLVPTCSICNNKKGDDDFKKYIHAYYETFPKEPFLLADVSVESLKFVIKFSFDYTVITDVELQSKLQHQTDKIDLWSRISKSSNSFINDLLGDCYTSDLEQLKIWLNKRLISYKDQYGLNDWRTAVVRGIIDCSQLSIDVIESYKNRPIKVNNGAGA